MERFKRKEEDGGSVHGQGTRRKSGTRTVHALHVPTILTSFLPLSVPLVNRKLQTFPLILQMLMKDFSLSSGTGLLLIMTNPMT